MMAQEFWCAVCSAKKSEPFLEVASKDGHTLHKVCEGHLPKEHKREAVVMVKSQPNADGVVRTIAFEDLLKELEKPLKKSEESPKKS